MARNFSPLCFDLDFQDLYVLATCMAFEFQTALRSLSLAQRDLTWRAGRCVFAVRPWPQSRAADFLGCGMLLLRTESHNACSVCFHWRIVVSQIADLAACQDKFSLNCGVRLASVDLELTQDALATKFAPLETLNSLPVKSLPIACG